jgi:hypothetical protein
MTKNHQAVRLVKTFIEKLLYVKKSVCVCVCVTGFGADAEATAHVAPQK